MIIQLLKNMSIKYDIFEFTIFSFISFQLYSNFKSVFYFSKAYLLLHDFCLMLSLRCDQIFSHVCRYQTLNLMSLCFLYCSIWFLLLFYSSTPIWQKLTILVSYSEIIKISQNFEKLLTLHTYKI